MAWLSAYGCTSAAGPSVGALWNAVLEARPLEREGAFYFPGERAANVGELLNGKLMQAFSEATRTYQLANEPYGVILASTKGLSNDFIWNATQEQLRHDPMTPLLREFLRRSGLQPRKALCVSNACSSALAAYALAELWLEQGMKSVVVLTADAVTPFVLKGFKALKLMSPVRPTPFGANRQGFWLGEAVTCVILTSERKDQPLYLRGVGLDTEGSAVARPSHSGESLLRAARQLPLSPLPDVVIAHGTGTQINDEIEDRVFAELFGDESPPIVGAKWCIGHTLANSAGLDTILAAQVLREGKCFALSTTSEVDPAFKGRYQLKSGFAGDFQRVLISSLGFGGMHAMALLEKRE
jgi:hypothetical protein